MHSAQSEVGVTEVGVAQNVPRPGHVAPVVPEPLRRSSAHVLVDAPGDLHADVLPLGDEVEHHLRRVLRLRDGESVTATDGQGSWREFGATVVGDTVTLTARAQVGHLARRDAPVTVATAIPKGDRVDWLVQKCTELGADRIVFVHAENSVVRWKPERARRQTARLQRVADEALRQSRRVWRVSVEGPVDATEVLASFAVAEPGGRPVRAGDHSIAIGPEGGWSPAEIGTAGETVDLGPQILRTETAATVAVALTIFCRDRV